MTGPAIFSCEREWDDEVDVVCTAVGLAGLAAAISVVDADGAVFLAEVHNPDDVDRMPTRRDWFGFGDDEATSAYLGELVADVDRRAPTVAPDLPFRRAGVFPSEGGPLRRRKLPPFEGWRLREWNAQCIASPSGYLYTHVTDWTSVTMDCGDGDRFTVNEIGSMTPDLDSPAEAVRAWLKAEAHERGVLPQPVLGFDSLVFEDGAVLGAVFATESGPLAIRARHGVLFCQNEDVDGDPRSDRRAGHAALRIALVGKEASRFGRVELLTVDDQGGYAPG